jgi:TATA-binding protein-associated factor Taf7
MATLWSGGWTHDKEEKEEKEEEEEEEEDRHQDTLFEFIAHNNFLMSLNSCLMQFISHPHRQVPTLPCP